MKIKNVYIKPDGQICACIVPVPEEPKYGKWCHDDRENLAKSLKYEMDLKPCKESAVRFENQNEALKLIQHRPLHPGFYPLTVEVEIVDYQCPTCGYTHSDAFLHLDHHLCKTPMPKHEKVARLIPEAKNMKTPDQPGYKYARLEKDPTPEDVIAHLNSRKVPEAKEEPVMPHPKTIRVKIQSSGTAPIVEESQTVKIEVNKNAIPRKAKLVEAYETDHQIIIMFGKEEIPESHSCDDMGCGSFSHVKYILTKP